MADLDVTPWITRLKDEATLLKQRVDGAAGLPTVKTAVRTPAAWVIPSAERAAENQLVGGHSQRVTETVEVITAVRNVKDKRGATAQGEMVPVRRAIKQALVNWSPSADHDPVEFVSGRLLKFGDGVLWWVDRFQTAYYERRA